jgi:hypothetical protein
MRQGAATLLAPNFQKRKALFGRLPSSGAALLSRSSKLSSIYCSYSSIMNADNQLDDLPQC